MIAILLSTHNGERYLDKLLASIMQQTYQAFVLYIFDDGSSDNTINIIFNWINKHPNRIKLVYGKPTYNPKANFFYLLKNIEAEYYMFCDQDDIWDDNKIDIFYKAAIKEDMKNPFLIHSDLMVIDENDNAVYKSYMKQQRIKTNKEGFNRMLIQNSITGCATMINRKLRDMALLSNNLDNVIMHDWWFGLIASRYGKLIFIDKKLVKYRQHKNNVIGVSPYINLSTIINKIINNTYKDNLLKTQVQAKDFVLFFGKEDNSLACKYSELHEESKLNRLLFYFKFKVLKYSIIRIIGQILFG